LGAPFFVYICKKETLKSEIMEEYIPKPIDLSDVSLTDDLIELREAIAENAHEIWAENRRLEGWTYGPVRDDKKKQTPDMVPYKDLSDGEKEYDRATAMRSIKLLKKLGYDLVKVQETALYKEMIERIRNSKEEYHCSNCGGFIFKHQVFCEHCGHKIEKSDWED
jgi:hypothetical protein